MILSCFSDIHVAEEMVAVGAYYNNAYDILNIINTLLSLVSKGDSIVMFTRCCGFIDINI